MKPKNSDDGKKLVARIEKEMNRPRLTESVRAEMENATPVSKEPSHRSFSPASLKHDLGARLCQHIVFGAHKTLRITL